MKNSGRAVIVGASSGIGYALAWELAGRGYQLGLTARRTDRLSALEKELPGPVLQRYMDVADTEKSVATLRELILALGEADLIVLNSGVNPENRAMDYSKEEMILDVNVRGIAALANAAFHYFQEREKGHLVVISSIAGLRGSPWCPAYSASKAFVSNYLQGLRLRNTNPRIFVTDIRPGFVETEMIAQSPVKFWVASPQKAAKQIADAIRQKRKVAYISRRYLFVSWIYRLLPGFFIRRCFHRFRSGRVK